MVRRLRDFGLALGVVIAAYSIYALTIAQWLEPPKVAGRKDPVPPPTPGPDLPNPFAHLFEPGDWELDQPKVLLTSQGTLLFLDYRPLENGRLEIQPCTLILYSEEKDGQTSQSGRPTVLRAPEGAELQFDAEVDLARGEFGKMTGGRIRGDIRIFSPESVPGANDALEITTHNLRIDRLTAETMADVKFRYGSSFGSGKDLKLTMLPAEKTSSKSKTLAIGGIDKLQLNHVHEVQLASRNGSLMPAPEARPSRSAATDDSRVRITCDGPFKFDVTRRVATFDDKVIVERLVAKTPSDRLRCEQLAIFLSDEDPKASSAQAKQTTPGKNDVERILATGKPVVLDAPSHNAHTEAEQLEYNLKTRQVLLKSMKAGARVFLRRGSDEFHAPQLAYEMVEGKRLGKLWAPGPGRLVSQGGGGLISNQAANKSDAPKMTAEWTKEVRIRPDNGQQLVSLLGGALVKMEGQGTFKSDELHLWLVEEDSTVAGASAIRPDRLLATGTVKADSPQVSAEVERLEAWFKPVASPVAPAVPSNDLMLSPPGVPMPPEPSLREPVFRIREPKPTAEKVAHFHATGETIRMQIEQRGSESSVQQLSLEGKKVRIQETNAAEGEEPLWLAGRQLDLDGGTGENAVLTVIGEPAMISARGLMLRSTELKLNRRDNRVTVDQAGAMTLPIEQDFHGQKLADPQDLTIAWKGSMVFDGLSARFRRGVTIRGNSVSGSGDELQAHLTSQVDFTRTSTTRQTPEVGRIVLAGNAELQHRTYNEEGRQQSVENMTAQSLDVDRMSGALVGVGPGWLRRVQVGTQPALATAPTAVAMVPSGGDDELSYLRVDFTKEFKGNLHRRQVEFGDPVQAVSGPVPTWDDIVDPDQGREALGTRGVMLTAAKLMVAEFTPPGTKKGSLEMTASGNARVEGREFTARSHRLTYAAAKSQLVLEGDGRNDAEIRHQFKNSVSAQKILFWQDTGAVKLEGGKSINIGPTSGLPSAAPRSPRDIPLR